MATEQPQIPNPHYEAHSQNERAQSRSLAHVFTEYKAGSPLLRSSQA
jgi:hypothetical protein